MSQPGDYEQQWYTIERLEREHRDLWNLVKAGMLLLEDAITDALRRNRSMTNGG
jgi:hypothetical protein